MTRMQLQL